MIPTFASVSDVAWAWPGRAERLAELRVKEVSSSHVRHRRFTHVGCNLLGPLQWSFVPFVTKISNKGSLGGSLCLGAEKG